jgi:ribonuclease HI
VGSQYISPTADLRLGVEEWSDKFNTTFKNCNLILGGDFNARSTLWGYSFEDDRGSTMIDLCFNNNLSILNSIDSPPTFHYHGRQGWPDLTLSRHLDGSFVVGDWRVLDEPSGSDHEYITFNLTTKLHLKTTKRYKTKYGNHLKFIKNFKPEVPTLLSNLTLITNPDQLDDFTNTLIQKIITASNAAYKFKNFSKTTSFLWWSPQLASRRNRLRALNRKLKSQNTTDTQLLKQKISKERALYRKSLERAKSESWSNFCSKAEKTFGTLFKLAHNKTFKPHEIKFTDNSNNPTDTLERLQLLTSSIFGNDPPPYLVKIQNFTHNEPITPAELYDALKTLNKNKAPGHDCIDVRILLQVHNTNNKLLLNWANKCFKLAHFPKPLRNGEIVYFLKPNKAPDLPSSYRPICLLPTLSKTLEKLINKRLIFHLETTHFLSDNQHGFRERKSCDTALSHLYSLISHNRNSNILTHITSIDINKAFDAVHWPTLINTLKKSNCPPVLINLIITYLQNRTIIINSGTQILQHTLNKGCPQGSVLGPTLWLVMAQNILSNFKDDHASLIAFADDFLIITSGEHRRIIEKRSQVALNQFVLLASQNHLSLSADKTFHTTFNRSRAVLKRFPSITLNNKFIPHNKTLKYLGLTLQHNLRWHAHIKALKTKIQVQQFSLNRVSGRLWGVPGHMLKTWYLTTTERTFAFASAVWAADLNKAEISQLQSCQRPYLIKITRTFKTSPTLALNTLAGIPPLHLKLLFEAHRASVFQLGKPPNSLAFLNNKQILIKQPSFHLKPSNFNLSFSNANPNTHSQYNIYTDGSKTQDGVGAAFVVFRNNVIIHQQNYKLNPEASVYQAEIQAIQESINWLSENNNPLKIKNISLFSDSQSSLKAIVKFKQQNPAIQNLQTQLTLLTRSLSLKLFWIKGHAGCSGNETADNLAKLATSKPQIDLTLPLPPSYVKSQLKTILTNDWQTLWSNSDRGRSAHSFIPKISTLTLFDSPHLNSLITNHGPFPQYFSKFKIFDSPLCVCGSEGSSRHYMFHCPLTRSLHFKQPNNQFWLEWSHKLNSNKSLRKRAQLLVTWLQEHQNDTQHP